MKKSDAAACQPGSLGLPPPVAFDAPGLATVSDPPEAALALVLANWTRAAGRAGVLHVARTETRARRLARAASGFRPDLEILVLPPWDCLPYDRFSPSLAVMGRRMAVLRRLAQPPPEAGRLVVTTIDALLQRLPSLESWADAVVRIEVGQALALDSFRIQLIRLGYVLDERVDEPGEAAIRGEVIDLFPGGADEPVRLRLMGERVSAINRYDAGSQRTVAEIKAVTLARPVSEVALGADEVREALQPCQDAGDQPEEHPQPVTDVLTGPRETPRRLPGLEHRLPLFYDHLDTVFEFLPDALLALDPGVHERRTAWLEQVRDAYEHRRTLQLAGPSHPAAGPRPLEPWHLYLDDEAWERHRSGRPVVALVATGRLDLGALPVPRFHEDRDPGKALVSYLRERLSVGDRIVLTTNAGRRRQLVRRVERALGVSVQPIEAWSQIAGQPPDALSTMAIGLSAGLPVRD